MDFPSTYRIAILILSTLAGGVVCAESGTQNLNQIRQAAEQAASINFNENNRIRIEAQTSPLDPRLTLAACSEPLETFFPNQKSLTNRVSVGIRCTAPRSWTLFVPVQIRRYAVVASATRHLAKNQIVSKNDIQMVERELGQLSNRYIDKPELAIGYQVKRPVRAGHIIRSSALKPPILIHKGDKVPIVSQNQAFEIRVQGEALHDGAIGDRIRVKNTSSNRTVEGTISPEGMVFVGTW